MKRDFPARVILGGFAKRDCKVVDISESGARIAISGAIEQDTGNDEPSLGWTDEEAARGRTYAGSHGTTADREQGEPARQPQNRTSIDREPITVEVSYRQFLRGLTPEQRRHIKAARQRGVGNDVVIA